MQEHARHTTDSLSQKRLEELLIYPPGVDLSEAEKQVLTTLSNNPALYAALQKILIDQSAQVFFDLLNLVDQTSDPDTRQGSWTGVRLVDANNHLEKGDMLHDEFLATYWDWYENH